QTPGDFRAFSPRFQAQNIDTNLALVDALAKIANTLHASVAQVAIAWVAAQGRDIIPLIGARRRDRLTEALGSQAVKLTPADLGMIERAVPKGAALGARYPEHAMAALDSER